MSEVASAPATSQRGRRASARGRRNRLNALEALERGFALFKNVRLGGVAVLLRGRAAGPLFHTDVGGKWADSVVRWRAAGGGGAAHWCICPARMERSELHAGCAGARVRRAETKTRGRDRTTGGYRTLACMENRPERCCSTGAYDFRRGAVVLLRVPIRQP